MCACCADEAVAFSVLWDMAGKPLRMPRCTCHQHADTAAAAQRTCCPLFRLQQHSTSVQSVGHCTCHTSADWKRLLACCWAHTTPRRQQQQCTSWQQHGAEWLSNRAERVDGPLKVRENDADCQTGIETAQTQLDRFRLAPCRLLQAHYQDKNPGLDRRMLASSGEPRFAFRKLL